MNRTLGWLAVPILLALPAYAASESAAPTIGVHGRSLAPGELVRVVVTSQPGARSVTGTFRGEPLHFVAVDTARKAWAAWVAIALDAAPGAAVAAATVTLADGAVLPARAEVTIEARKFPTTQSLKVDSKYVEPPSDVQARIAREQAKLAAIYKRRTDLAPPAERWVRPVPGEPTGVFGARRIFNGKPRDPHPGIDLRAATGTPVACSGPGTVVLAEDLWFSGNTVIVDHGGGLFTIYAHLSRIDVTTDSPIAAGAAIGLSGATGRVTGPHLHWGLKVGKRIANPMSVLDDRLWSSN